MEIDEFKPNDEVPFDDFISIELLSLSNNKITDITYIGQFYTLLELNISYN